MIGYVHSIESFGTVDGPGIRFVVFLQGCPLRCAYCHNPDTWQPKINQQMTVDEILEKYQSKKSFYQNGGITVTGGEPLMQIDFVIELFSEAKKRNIHTCLDTSGITFRKDNIEKFERLCEVTDLIMLDIKHIDDKEHRLLTQQSNVAILDFARYLSDKKVPVWIRHVVVPTITDNEEYLYQLGEFIGELKNVKALDVLPYHEMGKDKYEELGLNYPLKHISALSREKAIEAKKVIIKGIRDSKEKKKK